MTALQQAFPGAKLVDRRERPSHGYRAVHLIVRSHGKLVEIQVRTWLQDLWAQLSEKLADEFDPAIKYGGGPEQHRADLADMAELIRQVEQLPGSANLRTTLAGQLQRIISRYEKRVE